MIVEDKKQLFVSRFLINYLFYTNVLNPLFVCTYMCMYITEFENNVDIMGLISVLLARGRWCSKRYKLPLTAQCSA